MKRLVLPMFALALCPFVANEAHSQNKVVRSVSNDAIEKILESLPVKYQRAERKDKDSTVAFYEFTRGDVQLRLFNYGSDLWIESTFEKKMKLDDINRWNAAAKFSRLVLIEQKDKTMLSLESQLDCLGGVTDAMIRQYISRFEEEAKKFAKIAK
jgi:hypothetical protein